VGDHLGIPPVVCFWFLLSLRFPTFLSTEAHQEALLLPAPTPDFFCSAAYPPPFAFFCHEPPDVNEAPRRQYHDDLELEGRQPTPSRPSRCHCAQDSWFERRQKANRYTPSSRSSYHMRPIAKSRARRNDERRVTYGLRVHLLPRQSCGSSHCNIERVVLKTEILPVSPIALSEFSLIE
jgi:hypothetical protein